MPVVDLDPIKQLHLPPPHLKGLNALLTRYIHLSYLPCVKDFCLPTSASCLVNIVVVVVGWLLSVSQGRTCSDNFTCCRTEIEVADQTFHLTQSQYTDTGPTSPSTDPISPGAWSANF